MAYYRNNQTGRVQFHPKSGLGASLNSTEIADDGKPVKPRTSLAPSADEIRTAKGLLKDHSAPALDRVAAQVVVDAGKAAADKASEANSKTSGKSAEDTNQKKGAD